jgi:hypothetical protein
MIENRHQIVENRNASRRQEAKSNNSNDTTTTTTTTTITTITTIHPLLNTNIFEQLTAVFRVAVRTFQVHLVSKRYHTGVTQ